MTSDAKANLIPIDELILEVDPVVMIRQGLQELEKRGLIFAESYDDLDDLSYSLLELNNGHQISLIRHTHSPQRGVEMCVQYGESGTLKLLQDAFLKLNLNRNDIVWIRPDIGPEFYGLIDHSIFLVREKS